MEEYIRLEEEKTRRQGRTFNWQTATYGKMEYCENEDDSFTNLKTEYPAIVFDDTSDAALSCEPTVSPLDNHEIDFNISFDKSDDEDYMVIFDENSFSCKIIFVDNLKTDSKDENDKVNMPSSLSPEPTFGYIDDLDLFKDFENEFPTITYNDLKSKSDPLIEPSVNMAPLPHRDLRHPWLRYQVNRYDEGIIHSYEQRLETIWGRAVNRRRLFEIRAPLVREFILEFLSTCRMSDTEMRLDVADTLCFQLGGARHRMTWRQFILALGLHTQEEMAKAGFKAYWSGSERASKKVIGVNLFYLCRMDRGAANVPYLLAQYLFRHAERRKSRATLSVGHFIGRLASHFGLAAAAGAPRAAEDAPAADEGVQAVPAPVQAPQPPPPAPQHQTISITEQTRVFTWMIRCMTQLMDASGRTYQAFDSTLVCSLRVPYQRRVRPRAGDASTSITPHTDDQPDP
ncbi:hypothetical protein Tco_0015932 [Tanacetum coccineum]